ncbi:hypothetical protein ACFQPF_12280 [Fictibacillus iocasae]|uniref:Uncharacterized protein n=1 Tax=Fictibacillus iocasae TaxID=2715437 RepID=A0ABW2NSW9_9BACL
METKEVLAAEFIAKWLTDNSNQIINSFLTYYEDSSLSNMRSNVYKMLYSEIKKNEVSKVNFEDYRNIFPDKNKKLTSQESYRNSFFKYLYSFDHMELPFGFETIFPPKDYLIRHFERLKIREPKKILEKERKILTIEELTSIQNVIEADSTKLETLKMQFCWYAIFELGIDINELRHSINSNNFDEGVLHTKDATYKLPVKFHDMFIRLSERDSNYNGFYTLDILLKNLGEYAKLERKLLPIMVKLTRKGYLVPCGNCGENYTNLSYNWLSVNNRIICVDCAETLKKKSILK